MVSQCEHCRQEKLLHEKLRFSGVEKSFCSEGKEMQKGPEALDLAAMETMAEKGRVLGMRSLGPGPWAQDAVSLSTLRLWGPGVWERGFRWTALKR